MATVNGDPVVRQIVEKLYPETGEEYCESVVLYESQVIVSRETLAALVDALSPEAAAKALTDARGQGGAWIMRLLPRGTIQA